MNIIEKLVNKPIQVNIDKEIQEAASPKSIQTMEQAEAIASSSPSSVPAYEKPSGMSDEDYKHLLNFYSPETISSVFKPYDPAKNENFFQRLYESSSRKPEMDEKALRNQRTMGAIGDSVKLLAQLYAANKGAYITPNKESLTDYFSNREKELRNIYLERMDEYDKGMMGAKMRDIQRAYEIYNNDRKDMQRLLSNKYMLDQRNKELAYKAQKDKEQKDFERWKADRSYGLQEKNLALKDKALSQSNAAKWASIRNTQDYRDKLLTSKGNNNKTVPLHFKDGTKIDVPEAVWKANYPVLIDVMSQSGVKIPPGWFLNPPSSAQVEYFVKANKDKLPEEAKQWLKEIASGESAIYGAKNEPAPVEAEVEAEVETNAEEDVDPEVLDQLFPIIQ